MEKILVVLIAIIALAGAVTVLNLLDLDAITGYYILADGGTGGWQDPTPAPSSTPAPTPAVDCHDDYCLSQSDCEWQRKNTCGCDEAIVCKSNTLAGCDCYYFDECDNTQCADPDCFDSSYKCRYNNRSECGNTITKTECGYESAGCYKFSGCILEEYATETDCSDGTDYGACSINTKPKYCDKGFLVNNCTECGCPTDSLCNASNGLCASITAPVVTPTPAYTSQECKTYTIEGYEGDYVCLEKTSDDAAGGGGPELETSWDAQGEKVVFTLNFIEKCFFESATILRIEKDAVSKSIVVNIKNNGSGEENCGFELIGAVGSLEPGDYRMNVEVSKGGKTNRIAYNDFEALSPETPGMKEGEIKHNLQGAGMYLGQTVSVRLDTVWSDSAAVFALLDSQGNEIDSITTVEVGANLNGLFADQEGSYALTNDVKIEKIHFNENTGEGTVEVIFSEANIYDTLYGPGDIIDGLTGAGEYAGQKIKLRIDNVWSTDSAAFSLLDASGNEIDNFTTTQEGVALEEHFEDSQNEYALATKVNVLSVIFNSATGDGGVVLEIKHTAAPTPAPATSTTCTETDDKIDSQTRGTLTSTDPFGTEWYYTDICDLSKDDPTEDILIEYYCEGDVNKIARVMCQLGCRDGVCVNGTTYDIGDIIGGLTGAGLYAGQEVKLRVDEVWNTNSAEFTLLDASGNEIDNITITQERVDLEENFTDSLGQYALATKVKVLRVNFNSATGNGNVVLDIRILGTPEDCTRVPFQDMDGDGCHAGLDSDCGGREGVDDCEISCNDGIDNDCDGYIDEADPDGTCPCTSEETTCIAYEWVEVCEEEDGETVCRVKAVCTETETTLPVASPAPQPSGFDPIGAIVNFFQSLFG